MLTGTNPITKKMIVIHSGPCMCVVVLLVTEVSKWILLVKFWTTRAENIIYTVSGLPRKSGLY